MMMIAPRTQRIVAPEQMARLSEWNARKPVIAIMGEFSAGKSTLLNMLIGRQILPTQVTATKLPPVWLRHGTDEPYRVDKANRRHPIDLNDLATVPVKDTRYIRIFCEAEVLESCDLLDTPGISDPNIPMGWWIKALGYANAVLWCTHAGQAWRESERSAWESLPERLRRHSLLLVTRSDKITSEIDMMKIDTRLRRETESLFGGRLFISLTNALRALEGEGDAGLWTSCGAETFVDMLAGSIAALNDDRTVAIRRYRVDPSSMPRVTPRRVRPGVIGDETATDDLSAARMTSGAEVVTLRPMRVVATNDSPVEAAATARPTLHEVTGQEPREAPLLLNEPVTAEAPSPEPAIEGAQPIAAADQVTAMTTDFGVAAADGFSDDDDEFVRQSMSLSLYDDAVTEQEMAATAIEAIPQVDVFDPADVTEIAPDNRVDQEMPLADDVMEIPADLPSGDHDDQATQADEIVSELSSSENFTIAGLNFEEVPHEDLVEEIDGIDPLTILAKLSEPNHGYAAPNPFDLPPRQSAEDTIEAVLASVGLDDAEGLTAADETDEQMAAEQLIAADVSGTPSEASATGLWQDVIASRQISSVQDMLSAMTDFVTALDAAGFKLNQPNHAPNLRSAEEIAAIQHRRQMRAARRQHG